MTWFGIASFGTAALAYGAMTAVLLGSHPGGRNATWITAASVVSTIWAAGMVVLLSRPAPLAAVVGLEALHGLLWTACMLSWLAPSPSRGQVPIRVLMLAASGAFGAWGVLASLFAGVEVGTESAPGDGTASGLALALRASVAHQSIWLALLGIGLLGLLAVEQVFRNAREEQRKGLRLLCLAVGAIFVINVFVYSQASLLGGLIPIFWEGRGFATAALAPLVVIALKRQSEWESELFVSRQVAFYTATLVAVGGYLLTMGVVGYVIRAIGGEWGLVLESGFLVAALAILVYVLFSSSIRARAKVFLVKHFYRNKYDYRYEWLQLTSALSRTGDSRVLATSALDGIGRIVGSREGSLWLAADGGRYEQAATLDGGEVVGRSYDALHPVVAFLQTQGWVIDSEEYRRQPDRYGSAFGDPADGLLPRESLIVPLDCQGYLQGFAILTKPPGVESLNFEDHDILKTAGRQVAIVLAQALTQEQLTATRQFEAVNKLATFLMHDLKNVVAQQELVVANAQRFGHRQEFFDDAIATVRSGAERMRKVLDQLRSAVHAEPSRSRADVSKVLMEVRSHCADREPVPEVDMSQEPVWVDMDRDKLASVLTHVIRNAQDATPASGRIGVELERSGSELVITVSDTGKGMDPSFVRERLFRPFDSTKGAKGMGIGAYQVRETVRATGGDVEVESDPGNGTRFRVRLPLVDAKSPHMMDKPAA